MRFLIQRVNHASVKITDTNTTNSIWKWLLVYIWIDNLDVGKISDFDFLVNKLLNIRVFSDENGRLNLSLRDIDWEIMVISNFTLMWNCKKGTKPDFSSSANFDAAKIIYDEFIKTMEKHRPKIATWLFGGNMLIQSEVDWPVNIISDQ